MYHHASTGGVASGTVPTQYYARIPPETDSSPKAQGSAIVGGSGVAATSLTSSAHH